MLKQLNEVLSTTSAIQGALLVALLLGIFNAQATQFTYSGGKLRCEKISDFHQCLGKIESELLANNKKIVSRNATAITLTLLDGSKQTIVAKDQYGATSNAVALTNNKRFLTIRTREDQDSFWEIYDRLTGKSTFTPDYPLFSPDESRVVASYSGLDYIYAPALSLYAISANGVKEIFTGKNEDPNNADPAWRYWGASQVKWINNKQIAFIHRTLSDKETRCLLSEDSQGNWHIKPNP